MIFFLQFTMFKDMYVNAQDARAKQVILLKIDFYSIVLEKTRASFKGNSISFCLSNVSQLKLITQNFTEVTWLKDKKM